MFDFLGDAARNPEHYGVHTMHYSRLKHAVHILEGMKGKDPEEKKNPAEEEYPNETRNRIFTPDGKALVLNLFGWEGVDLPCCSQYDLLKLVLSILGRAPRGANRRNHHLALLIMCAKFFVLAAGEKPKRDATNLVSITFGDEDEDNPPIELADSLEKSQELNVRLDATVPKHRELKNKIRRMRYDFLIEEGKFCLPGFDGRWWFGGKRAKWPRGQCAETFALVLLKKYIVYFLPMKHQLTVG